MQTASAPLPEPFVAFPRSALDQSIPAWFLALLAAMTFLRATLGINVIANFVSPAFDVANVFPQFVGAIGATMGPLFGVMMSDYYLIARGKLDVPALHQEHGR